MAFANPSKIENLFTPVQYFTPWDVNFYTVDNRPLLNLAYNDQILAQAIDVNTAAVGVLQGISNSAYGTDSGTANHYNITFAPAPGTLLDGFRVYFRPQNPNSGASVVSIPNFPNLPLVLQNNTGLVGNEILQNGLAAIVYSVTLNSWILENPNTLSFTNRSNTWTQTNVFQGLPTFQQNISQITTGYNSTGLTVGWDFTAGQGEVDLLLGPQGGAGGLNIYQLTGSGAFNSATPILQLSNNGALTVPGAISGAPAVTITQVPNLSQVQLGQYRYAIATGSTNSYIVSLTPALASLPDGFELTFLPIQTNTGPTTLQLGVAAIPVLLPYSGTGVAQQLDGGEILANCPAVVTYSANSAGWILQNPAGNAKLGGDPNIQFSAAPATAADQVVVLSQLKSTSPAGSLLDFAGPQAPQGYLVCDGSAYSRTTYASLFAAIQTYWGGGDGSTTFNVPNLQRRATIGAGGNAISGPGASLGNTGGEETHGLTVAEIPSHGHGISDPTHAHPVYDPAHNHALLPGGWGQAGQDNGGGSFASQGNQYGVYNQRNGPMNVTGSSTTGVQVEGAYTGVSVQATGGGSQHNNMPPSAVVLKCIKY